MPVTYQTYRPLPRKQKMRKRKAIVIIGTIAVITCASLILIRAHSSKATEKPVEVSSSSTTAIPSATAAPTAAAVVDTSMTDKLKTAWSTIANTRAGDIDIAVYNNQTGQTAHYTNAAGTLNTASIVKLSIAEEVLLQAQSKGVPLTATQLSNLQAMIEESDNSAASSLWDQVGGAVAMNNFFASIDASSTSAAPGGYWGLTQTTSIDQLAVLNVLAYSNKFLNAASISLLSNLINNVEPDQEWGINAGIGNNATYGLKNGWLEDADTSDAYADTTSWTVDSIGHVQDTGVDYTIAVLTDGQSTEQYGIDTIESLSRVTWTILSQ